MLLFSDNDILIKLGLLRLLPDFIEVLGVQNHQVYISSATKYALPKQLKKYSTNETDIDCIIELINSFSIIEEVNQNLVEELSTEENIDSGEAILASKLIEKRTCFLATGDKRFLNAISKTKFSEYFYGRCYTLELAIYLLCKEKGYHLIKAKIIDSKNRLNKDIDGVLKLCFKDNSSETNDLECLDSYMKEFSEFHAKEEI